MPDKLPDWFAATLTKRIRPAFHAESAHLAETQPEALVKELERTHPGAAGSLRDGLAETLTEIRLGMPPTLARTLPSMNCVESLISIARTSSSNVKNGRAATWRCAGDRSG